MYISARIWALLARTAQTRKARHGQTVSGIYGNQLPHMLHYSGVSYQPEMMATSLEVDEGIRRNCSERDGDVEGSEWRRSVVTTARLLVTPHKFSSNKFSSLLLLRFSADGQSVWRQTPTERGTVQNGRPPNVYRMPDSRQTLCTCWQRSQDEGRRQCYEPV